MANALVEFETLDSAQISAIMKGHQVDKGSRGGEPPVQSGSGKTNHRPDPTKKPTPTIPSAQPNHA